MLLSKHLDDFKFLSVGFLTALRVPRFDGTSGGRKYNWGPCKKYFARIPYHFLLTLPLYVTCHYSSNLYMQCR